MGCTLRGAERGKVAVVCGIGAALAGTLLLGSATTAEAQDIGLLGQQFQVNSYTTSSQLFPAVGPDGAGGFVVVWDSIGSAGTDSSSNSIQAQRYSSAGATLGTELQVNSYTTNSQLSSAVGPDGAGGFVVVWHSGGSEGTDSAFYSIQAQRYSSAGAALGAEFQVNSYTTNSQLSPAVGPDGAGGFVVVWHSNGSAGTDNSSYSVRAQRYSSAGAALGTEFEVNSYTTNSQNDPQVGPDAAGGFILVWTSAGSAGTDSALGSIQAQRYSSAGAALGSQFQVNSYTTGSQTGSAVSQDGSGGFLVVWQSVGSTGTDSFAFSIQAQRLGRLTSSPTPSATPATIPSAPPSGASQFVSVAVFIALAVGVSRWGPLAPRASACGGRRRSTSGKAAAPGA